MQEPGIGPLPGHLAPDPPAPFSYRRVGLPDDREFEYYLPVFFSLAAGLVMSYRFGSLPSHIQVSLFPTANSSALIYDSSDASGRAVPLGAGGKYKFPTDQPDVSIRNNGGVTITGAIIGSRNVEYEYSPGNL